jgi:uncharacterized protein (DUF2252 family)
MAFNTTSGLMSPDSLPSLDDRYEEGRAQREHTPRATLATLAERPASYDPVARLMWQGESRVAQLLPIRYQRMLVNPLAFYRGCALLMADDLARGPSTAIEVQICGDAHLSNFGVFSSPERQQVFDVNDFDETDVGPFEWDVKRLVTSTAIVSHYLGHDAHQQETIAMDVAKEYRRAMQRFARETRLDVWYSTLDVDAVMKDLHGFLADHAMQRVNTVIGGAKSQDSAKSYGKMVNYENVRPRIRLQPPLITALGDTSSSPAMREVLDRVLDGYKATLSSDRRELLSQYVPVDVARKVVGVGSVGTRCYVMLFLGRDRDDPFFLQFKEAQSSAVSLTRGRSSRLQPGERVVHGQKLMQATPDPFLGWYTLDVEGVSRSFYVRQLYDNKASVIIEQLNESLLVAYGRACSWALARAHARSGRSAEIAGYLGKNDRFETSVTAFALAYRDRNQSDYLALQSAAKQGRITVAS